MPKISTVQMTVTLLPAQQTGRVSRDKTLAAGETDAELIRSTVLELMREMGYADPLVQCMMLVDAINATGTVLQRKSAANGIISGIGLVEEESGALRGEQRYLSLVSEEEKQKFDQEMRRAKEPALPALPALPTLAIPGRDF